MRIKNKKNYKLGNNYCCLCGENDPNVLDVHRIYIEVIENNETKFIEAPL
jgi:hypothetical protein